MITDTMISWGDQLGAQMSTYCQLYFVAKENGQELVLVKELRDFRRGYQFLDVFNERNFKLINGGCGKLMKLYNFQFKKRKNWKTEMNRMYNSKILIFFDKIVQRLVCFKLGYVTLKKLSNNVKFNKTLLNLEKNTNYNIQGGFGTCSEWDKYSEEIKEIFEFKQEIIDAGDLIWNSLFLQNKKTVSVHFRLTDYLVSSSLNLEIDYYKKAMNFFDNEVTYVVFSDDIDMAKRFNIFDDKNVVYMDKNSPGIDMYLMTKCKSNIIANSSFSFWGGYLNKGVERVICPHDFIGKIDIENLYMNGNWYPPNWVAI